jgi:hypothetical protein
MSLTEERRMPFTRGLLWELPTAIAMGLIGRGIGEYVGLDGFPLISSMISISYIGPRTISWAMQKYLGLPDVKR